MMMMDLKICHGISSFFHLLFFHLSLESLWYVLSLWCARVKHYHHRLNIENVSIALSHFNSFVCVFVCFIANQMKWNQTKKINNWLKIALNWILNCFPETTTTTTRSIVCWRLTLWDEDVKKFLWRSVAILYKFFFLVKTTT